MLRAGADKVSVNTAAVQRPELIGEIATEFGAQCCVCAIDAKRARRRPRRSRCTCTAAARRRASTRSTGRCAATSLGAGEILLTSMDRDGTRAGFDLELTGGVADAVGVPVIASGGVGTLQHLVEGVIEGGATRRAGRQHLPLRRAHDRRGQGGDDRRRHHRPPRLTPTRSAVGAVHVAGRQLTAAHRSSVAGAVQVAGRRRHRAPTRNSAVPRCGSAVVASGHGRGVLGGAAGRVDRRAAGRSSPPRSPRRCTPTVERLRRLGAADVFVLDTHGVRHGRGAGLRRVLARARPRPVCRSTSRSTRARRRSPTCRPRPSPRSTRSTRTATRSSSVTSSPSRRRSPGARTSPTAARSGWRSTTRPRSTRSGTAPASRMRRARWSTLMRRASSARCGSDIDRGDGVVARRRRHARLDRRGAEGTRPGAAPRRAGRGARRLGGAAGAGHPVPRGRAVLGPRDRLRRRRHRVPPRRAGRAAPPATSSSTPAARRSGIRRPRRREQMRAIARRAGERLRAEVDYRGAFTVDGVLTGDGFLPTELNPRNGAGLATMSRELRASRSSCCSTRSSAASTSTGGRTSWRPGCWSTSTRTAPAARGGCSPSAPSHASCVHGDDHGLVGPPSAGCFVRMPMERPAGHVPRARTPPSSGEWADGELGLGIGPLCSRRRRAGRRVGGMAADQKKRKRMKYRRLGRSGLQVSVLSFGSWVTFDTQMKDDAGDGVHAGGARTPAATSSTTPRRTPAARARRSWAAPCASSAGSARST